MASALELWAASALIETIERQCRDAIHSQQEEMILRDLVVRACRAFGIATIAERDPNVLAFPATRPLSRLRGDGEGSSNG